MDPLGEFVTTTWTSPEITANEWFNSDTIINWEHPSIATNYYRGKNVEFIKSILTDFKERCKITDSDDLISSMVKKEKLALLEELDEKLTGG